MPGFYFDPELDNVEDLTCKLEKTAIKALEAPQQQIRFSHVCINCERWTPKKPSRHRVLHLQNDVEKRNIACAVSMLCTI